MYVAENSVSGWKQVEEDADVDIIRRQYHKFGIFQIEVNISVVFAVCYSFIFCEECSLCSFATSPR